MDQFFLCSGLPRSGTTFLQRTLDTHPQISCPSEHDLVNLNNELELVYSRYNDFRSNMDRGKGGQGAKLVQASTLRKIFKATILTMAESAGQGKPICGLSDNSIINMLHFYSKLLGHPPIIIIVRNPIDRGLSAWRHNHRLARIANERGHSGYLKWWIKTKGERGGTIGGWLNSSAQAFNDMAENFANFSKTHENTILVRYEDLVNNKAVELCRIIQELGGDFSPEIINEIVFDSSLGQMKKNSQQPDFFGQGDTDWGNIKISDELRANILTICSLRLKDLGYSLENVL